MKKILILLLTTFLFTTSSAQDLSEFFSNLLPGEGITEASIQINEDDNPDIEILAVRDIKSEENLIFLLNLVCIHRKLIIMIDILQTLVLDIENYLKINRICME